MPSSPPWAGTTPLTLSLPARQRKRDDLGCGRGVADTKRRTQEAALRGTGGRARGAEPIGGSPWGLGTVTPRGWGMAERASGKGSSQHPEDLAPPACLHTVVPSSPEHWFWPACRSSLPGSRARRGLAGLGLGTCADLASTASEGPSQGPGRTMGHFTKQQCPRVWVSASTEHRGPLTLACPSASSADPVTTAESSSFGSIPSHQEEKNSPPPRSGQTSEDE